MHPGVPGISFYVVPEDVLARARSRKPVLIVDGPMETVASFSPGGAEDVRFPTLGACLEAYLLPQQEVARWEYKGWMTEEEAATLWARGAQQQHKPARQPRLARAA